VANLLALVQGEDGLHLDVEDEVIKGCLLTHEGEVVHPAGKQ